MPSAGCGVRSAECAAECGVRSPECGVRSAECGGCPAVPGRAGVEIACRFRMGWRRFTEIQAWQLSMQLRKKFDEILARSPACKDRRFCDDARDAAGSAPRNIAEGFGRSSRREFARFVDIARSSLLETQTNLLIAKDRRYMSEAEFDALWAVSEEAVATTTGLLKRLKSPRED